MFASYIIIGMVSLKFVLHNAGILHQLSTVCGLCVWVGYLSVCIHDPVIAERVVHLFHNNVT